MSHLSVICATCREPIIPIPDKGPDVYGCTSCGTAATKDEVFEEAKSHAKDAVATSFGQAIKKAAQRSKSLTYKPGKRPNRTYRFITDIAL